MAIVTGRNLSVSYNGEPFNPDYHNRHAMCRCVAVELPEPAEPVAFEVPATFTVDPDAMRIVTDLLLQAKLGEHYKN